ncbi:hypothetical protein JXQ70_11590 [bacterium]|nr:hypothetical protein [bacterium]
MIGSEQENIPDRQEYSSFSRVVLVDMKKKYIKHLLSLATLVIGIFVFSLLFCFSLFPYYRNMFLAHDQVFFQEMLQQQLDVVKNYVSQTGERYLLKMDCLARDKTLLTSMRDGKSLPLKTRAFDQASLLGNEEGLDFFFVLTSTGQVIYANSQFDQDTLVLLDHVLVAEALSGKANNRLILENRDWLAQIGLSTLLTKKVDGDKQKARARISASDQYLCLEMCLPVIESEHEHPVGVIWGGILLNGNSAFIEQARASLLAPHRVDSYLALIVQNNRIVSNFIARKGYLDNTTVSLNLQENQIDTDIEYHQNVAIMDKGYYSAYLPIRDNNLRVVTVLELGYDQKALFQSSLDFFSRVQKQIILLIIVTSLLSLVILRFLSNRFSDKLFVSLNIMAERISQLIVKMIDLSRHINQTSTEILGSSKEQAAYFDEQAASISETTATMEELATVTKQIASNAEQVVKVTEQTSTNAENGYRSVLDTIKSMKEIKEKNETSAKEIISLGEKSQKIGQVMRIITGIASQTKLIAFNASIEASAAGEIGKRFGVVATEVRRLAEDVVKSTDIIKKIITEIQKSTNRLVFVSEEETKKIDEGVHLSEVSGDSLKEILQIVNKSLQSAKQISLITQQQKTASDQVVSHLKEISVGAGESVKSSKNINTVILQLDELSKDLNTLVEESAQYIERRDVVTPSVTEKIVSDQGHEQSETEILQD